MQDPFLRALPKRVSLPKSVWTLHSTQGDYIGECEIERGRGLLIALALWLGRFPPAGQSVPVRLTVHKQGQSWLWLRDFDGHRTRSVLSYDSDTDSGCERFGMLCVWLKPVASDDKLKLEIQRLTLFGLPCPRSLLPRSATIEWQDDFGRFRFDVSAEMPAFGMLIRYHGWLTPLHRAGVVN